jgi:hypothetical protein
MSTAAVTKQQPHRARQFILVALLCALSIGMWIPDLGRAFGHPLGVQVHGVRYFQPGDIRDLVRTPVADRMRLVRNSGCWQASPGVPCDFYVIRNGRASRIHVVTVTEPNGNGIIVVMRAAVALLWLFAAAALVLLRPSHATWAFFVFALYGQTANNVFTEIGPAWWQVATSAFDMAWENAIPCVALIFALYLLQPERLPGWRRTALYLAYAFVFAVAAFESGATLAVAAGNTIALQLVHSSALVQQFVQDVPAFGAPLLLLATYLDSDRTTRERIRWVLVGFSIGAVAMAASMFILGKFGYFYYSLCFVIYVCAVTSSTMYAVLRHRIIDVNVILSRTLVYTLLSGLVVGLFAIVDLFFTKTLSENNSGLIADVVLALVLGFFLNSMHHRLDRFVDGILFRKRHIAENHVALVAQSLRHTPSVNSVNSLLIEEPVRAFDLTFGALARPVNEDELEIIFATVPELVGARVGSAGRLCSYVSSNRHALALRNHFWQSDLFARAGQEAAIAVPVFSHDDLDAVAFYGLHRTGTELDSDEVELIERAAEAAGFAYDRLRARALEAEISMLKVQHAV